MAAKLIDVAALSTFKNLLDLANAANFVLKSDDFTDEQKTRLANLSEYHIADDEQVDSMLAEVFGF